MSITKNIREIPLKLRQKASEDLRIEISGNEKYTSKKEYLNVFHVNEQIGYFPYHYARNILRLATKLRKDYPQANIVYKNEEFPLREEQVEVKTKAVSALNKDGSCILALYPGFGKTCLSIYLSSKLKMKTLYINNRLAIIDQIVESVKKFSQSKVQLLNTKTVLDPTADFYVVNAINVPKFKPGTFNGIGTLIIDEIHCMLSKVLSQALHYITPRYIIGLSATPYRDDGFNLLFDLYFGPERIYIPLYRKHIVYKVNTPLEPPIEFTTNGTLNWGTVLNFQAENETRNEKIIKILQKFNDRVFMIICKRVNQIKYLHQKLQELNESVDAIYANKKKYNREARILIGTGQKMGVGFDHPRVNALILAGDFEAYFIQTLGRSVRTPEVEPIIFDIVDKNRVLERHWQTRQKVYKEHGGIIKKLKWETLEDLKNQTSKEDTDPISILLKN
jgi:superfamily II DNA or RNA helicase